jgi:hypothetical protein
MLPDREWLLRDTLRNAIGVTADSWQWTGIRWMSYYGYYAAIALVPVTVLLLSLLMTLGRAGWPLHRGEFTHAVLRRCSISLAALGVLWLGISLAAAPALIRLAERDFHSKMDYFRDPEGWLEEVRRVIDEVEAERLVPEGGADQGAAS